MTKLIKLVLLLLVLASSSFAQRFGEQYRHFLGFTLDEDSLSTVERYLGPSPSIEEGQQGEWTKRIHYFSRQLRTLVTFYTDEMGHSGDVLQGFSIKSEAEDKYSLLPKNYTHLSIGPLSLGMTSTTFDSALGTVKWESNRGSVVLSGQDTTSGRIYDISISIVGLFKQAKLNELYVWMTRTH